MWEVQNFTAHNCHFENVRRKDNFTIDGVLLVENTL